TPSQIALLRLVPFIHFHLLSLYLIEISNGFKDYTKASLLTNIPLAVVYTSFVQHLSGFSPLTVMLFLVILFVCIHIFRHQEVIMKWNDFFQTSTKHSIKAHSEIIADVQCYFISKIWSI